MAKQEEDKKEVNSKKSNKSEYTRESAKANSRYIPGNPKEISPVYHNNEEPHERKYSTRLSCSESTKKLIIDDCVEEFIAHHPELRGINVTHNMILRQIAEYYLNH